MGIILYFRYLNFYSGPGIGENYAIYIQKFTSIDGKTQEILKMLNLKNNVSKELITFKGEVRIGFM